MLGGLIRLVGVSITSCRGGESSHLWTENGKDDGSSSVGVGGVVEEVL